MSHGFHTPHHKTGQVPLTIASLNENGYGVGQKAGQTLTVARTVPGDVAVVAPRTSSRWAAADLVKLLQPGPERVESGCAAFERGCGGCQWLHLDYKAQLEWKQKNFAAILRARANFKGTFLPIVAMDKPEGYRNKLSLKTANGRFVFVPESGEALAPRDCRVQTPALQKAWNALRNFKVAPGIEQAHLRSNAAGQVGIHVFASERPSLDAELRRLKETVDAVGLGATSRRGYRVLGDAVLTQTIGGTVWLVPHNGFFQTNEPMAGALLQEVRRAAAVTDADRVLDLYCGAGFFGLALAGLAREVVGIDDNAQSIEAATAGAVRSAAGNARFLAGDLGAVLAGLETDRNETAIVDPPRDGLLPHALEALIARAPRRIVYVSCYPQSLARDLKALAQAGWKATSCTPVDMFPHTSHLEAVVTFERFSGSRPTAR